MPTKPHKPSQPPKPTRSSVSANPGRSRRPDQAALSTGEAARYCFVSAGSVVNWITAGQVAAQRTAGGQYRIRVVDLHAFMRSHQMRTDQLDADFPPVPPCWQYWSERTMGAMRAAAERICFGCPVYRSGAKVCSEIRPFLPNTNNQARACAECQYRSLRGHGDAAKQGQF